jgi:hypothetical protein
MQDNFRIEHASAVNVTSEETSYMTCWLNIYGEANKAWLMSKPKKRMHVLRRTAGYTRWDHKRNYILTELQISQITELIYQYRKKLKRACWQDGLWQDPKNDSKIPTKREKKFRKTFEKVEGFCFVTPATGLSRPNTGKEDDDDLRNVLTSTAEKRPTCCCFIHVSHVWICAEIAYFDWYVCVSSECKQMIRAVRCNAVSFIILSFNIKNVHSW